MASERRRKRIGELVQEEVSTILLEEEEWPEGVLVTIPRVEVSEKGESAKVFVSVYPEDASEEVFTALEKHVGAVQYRLNRTLRMKPVPRIEFVEDVGMAKAARIEETLHKIKKEE